MLREIENYLAKLMEPVHRTVPGSSGREEERPAAGTSLTTRLLEVLLFSSNAVRVLQIGVESGHETVRMLKSSSDVEILVVEGDAGRVEAARAHVYRAEVADRVEFVGTEGLDDLAEGRIRFDLLLLNGHPRDSRRHLDFLLPIVEVRGLIVIQNMLLGGQLIELDLDADEELVRAQEALNGYFLIHPQLRAVILPMGDGVGVATKIQPLMTELGGPF